MEKGKIQYGKFIVHNSNRKIGAFKTSFNHVY